MITSGFDRILVATDGTESANAAVDLAGSLAHVNAAFVQVVQVWNLEIHHRHSASDAAVRHEAACLISDTVERLRGSGVQAEGRLAHADGRHVAALIAEVARHFEPNLLVVGSRSLSDWQSLVGHSASHDLLTSLSCPMLIVRSRDAGYEAGPIRVVVALQRADDVAPIVRIAAAAAANRSSRVLVIPVAWAISAEHTVACTGPQETVQATMDAAVQALAESGIAADAWPMRPGPAAGVLADAAGRWQADMVVLGSSRTGDAGSTLFGSVTHDLLRPIELPALAAAKG